MTESALIETLDALAMKRPIFHSEADFQHSLAWTIREAHPAIDVRLEWPFGEVGRRQYFDIALRNDPGKSGSEFTYLALRVGR